LAIHFQREDASTFAFLSSGQLEEAACERYGIMLEQIEGWQREVE